MKKNLGAERNFLKSKNVGLDFKRGFLFLPQRSSFYALPL